ncbi:MAG TPA: hypothetical protein DIT55_03140, partial [Spirochaetaceae bacterium]|nr:hypothetical protein [Spirochaetaceae bacterium]
ASTTSASAGATASSSEAASAKANASRGRKNKLSFAERRELDGLLPAIDALEIEKAELESYFGKPGIPPAQMRKAHERYEEVTSLIEAKTLRWEEIAQREAEL